MALLAWDVMLLAVAEEIFAELSCEQSAREKVPRDMPHTHMKALTQREQRQH